MDRDRVCRIKIQKRLDGTIANGGRRQRAANPERFRKAQKTYREKHRDKLLAKYSPEAKRDWWLRSNYGLTLEQWTALFEAQGSICALCSSADAGSKKGWQTDHCHVTGSFRGILCKKCNTLLGLLGDNAKAVRARLESILEYLK